MVEVLRVGDHIYGDILRSKKVRREGVMVLVVVVVVMVIMCACLRVPWVGAPC